MSDKLVEIQKDNVRKGHTWKRKLGSIDMFGYQNGENHNGPRCTKCGYGFCIHCKKDLSTIPQCTGKK